MLRQVLYTQWKWSKVELAVYAVIGFVVPVTTMKILTLKVTAFGDVIPISALLDASVVTGIVLVGLAAICGVTLAVRPWMMDHARAFVLSLSLPLRWSDFIRLRFAAGAALLLAPAAAVWFGGILAAAALPLPSTLHAYPTSLAARFLGACLVFYATTFALQHVAGRRAVKAAALAFVALALVELIAQTLHLPSPTVALWNVTTSWPGPFSVITARWMLIDA
ncbi:MAG TPA: hypothetical protein VG916_05430 [Gemmatimonadaceae bacterium]|nr:hypothetical protein [Gemmatimonadaceae bacterium]